MRVAHSVRIELKVFALALAGVQWLACGPAPGTTGAGAGVVHGEMLGSRAGAERQRGIRDISAYGDLACVVRADSRVWCWGRSGASLGWYGFNKPTLVDGIPPARRVFVGAAGVCTVPVAGGLHCAGEDWLGNTEKPLPEALSAPHEPRTVAIGDQHACAVDAAGAVWCWGDPRVPLERRWWRGRVNEEEDGSAGRERRWRMGPPEGPEAERVVGLEPVVQLVTDSERICAVDESDDIWCWAETLRFEEVGTMPVRKTVAMTRVGDVDGQGELELADSHIVLREGNIVEYLSFHGGGKQQREFAADITAVRAADNYAGRGLLVYARTASGRVAVSDGENPVTVLPMLSGVRSLVGRVERGDPLMCALTDDDRVFCWIGNEAPRDETPYPEGLYVLDARQYLGWVDMPSLVPAVDEPGPHAPAPTLPKAGDDEILALDVNNYRRACAVRGDGRTYCWIVGMEHRGAWLPTPPLFDLAVSYEDMCGVTREGQVRCWRLAKRKTLAFTPWQSVPIRGVAAIDQRGGLFCARHTNGRVTCFRASNDDETGALPQAESWVATGVRDARDISVRTDGVCGLRGTRDILCHHRHYGALTFRSPTPLQRLITAYEMVDKSEAAKKRAEEARKQRYRPRRYRSGLSKDEVPPIVGLAADGSLWKAELHESELSRVSAPTERWPDISIGWQALAYTRFNGCGIALDGRVHCWGRNDDGELGRGMASKFEAQPAPVSNLSAIRQVALHTGGACATDGTRVWCWGGTKWYAALEPEPVRVAIAAPIADFKLVGASGVALDRSGTLWIWGLSDVFGRPGGRPDNPTPVALALEQPVADIRLADGVACAIYRDGKTIECWDKQSDTRARIGLPGAIAELSIGYEGICARLVNRRVWCWHRPRRKRVDTMLGKTRTRAGLPFGAAREVVGMRGARSVSVGSSVGCGLDGRKRIRCWPMTREALADKSGPKAWSLVGVKATDVRVHGLRLSIATATKRFDVATRLDLTCPTGQRHCAPPRTVRLCDRFNQGRLTLPPCRRPGRSKARPKKPTATIAVTAIHERKTAAAPPPPQSTPPTPDGLPAAVVKSQEVNMRSQKGWCGLLADGSLYCSGSNESGRLGNGTGGRRVTPLQVMIPE